MKNLVILGGGESGTGAALLAKKEGYEVFLSDKGTIKTKYKNVLLNHGIEWEENRHTLKRIQNAAEVIKSPGIPDNVEVVTEIKRKNIPIISEIEFAARYTKGKLLGITGTNGKSTTASLTAHIFAQAGLDVCLAGNIGRSFAWALSERDYKYFVLELSSFQLDTMFDTHLDTAALLNITPDHLDRYQEGMAGYTSSKFRILQNMNEENGFIYCADDQGIASGIKNIKCSAEYLPYSIEKKFLKGAHLNGKNMEVIYNTTMNMNIEEIAIKGKHNVYNSMAASIMAKRHDIRNERIKESLDNYVNIDHRLEFVARVRSVDYINDSKATNVNAVWYALESCKKNIVWIAGGIDKGNDYNKLQELVKEKVSFIICLGIDNTNIINAFKNTGPKIYTCRTMTEVIDLSYRLSQPGDTVLLSPACASFDLFDNYEDRGIQFKELVKNL